MYRHVKGTRVHAVKFCATFNCPVEQLLALAREFDLTSMWNSFVLDSTVLHEPSIFESFVYAGNWLPFPFSCMDAVIHARGVDLSEVWPQAALLHVLHGARALCECLRVWVQYVRVRRGEWDGALWTVL